MSSHWKTGLKSEALEALPEILNLAQEILPEEKFLEALEISQMLIGSKKAREHAKAKLMSEIGTKPSRPLIYLWPKFQSLPRYTRDSIRYLGDYIDLLVKELTHEFIGGKARKSSLGTNVNSLIRKVPQLHKLAKKLKKYNDFLYTPGKHDFDRPPGRKHRFTTKEVVLTTYISAVLAEEIKSVSECTRIAVEKDNLYVIGGRWGSKDRVHYAEDLR